MPRILIDLSLLLLRVALGLYFLIAGVGKVKGELSEGLGTFYNSSFKGLQPDWLPNWLAMPYGYTLPWLEVLFGGLLILGILGRLTALVIFLMLASFIIALAMANGIDAQDDKAHTPFSPNYVLAGAALVLFTSGMGLISFDGLFKRIIHRKKAGKAN